MEETAAPVKEATAARTASTITGLSTGCVSVQALALGHGKGLDEKGRTLVKGPVLPCPALAVEAPSSVSPFITVGLFVFEKHPEICR